MGRLQACPPEPRPTPVRSTLRVRETDASGLLNHENPLLPALFSIDLEQERRLDDHDQRLDELEASLNNSGDETESSGGE